MEESHPGFGSQAYTYDLNGNRTTRTKDGVTEYYGYSANNTSSG